MIFISLCAHSMKMMCTSNSISEKTTRKFYISFAVCFCWPPHPHRRLISLLLQYKFHFLPLPLFAPTRTIMSLSIRQAGISAQRTTLNTITEALCRIYYRILFDVPAMYCMALTRLGCWRWRISDDEKPKVVEVRLSIIHRVRLHFTRLLLFSSWRAFCEMLQTTQKQSTVRDYEDL